MVEMAPVQIFWKGCRRVHRYILVLLPLQAKLIQVVEVEEVVVVVPAQIFWK